MTLADVYREGISEVTAADLGSAAELGCVVKLLAICEQGETATVLPCPSASTPR